MSFNQFVMKEQYQKVRGLGDRLELMKEQLDWKQFIPMIRSVFHDNKIIGGRPHTNEIIVVRVMLLQSWYGLSDEELEFQCHDRLSFRNFLEFPESIPDFSTIWKIRERLKNSKAEKKLWNELQRQLNEKGYTIKKGVIQDASFIEADLGRKRHHKEKKAKEHGEELSYTEQQKRHIDADGSFSIKHGQVHYGYKLHTKLDVDHHLIRDYDVTTASLHDSQINLVADGDIAAYRDKGYAGKNINCGNVLDKTMKKATVNKKLSEEEQGYNRGISGIRAPGERQYGVIKRVFHGGRTFVKRLGRVHIKEMFKCFAFDLYQLVTLERKRLA